MDHLKQELCPPYGRTFTKLNIALDYDDTFTANRPMWALIVPLMKEHGCDVRFVTARFETPNGYSNDEIIIDANNLNIPIIYCNGVQKATRCKDLDFSVDIWIDDFPVLIPHQAELECILRGARVNDDKQRTVLRTSDKGKEEQQNKWASNPLVIGG